MDWAPSVTACSSCGSWSDFSNMEATVSGTGKIYLEGTKLWQCDHKLDDE